MKCCSTVCALVAGLALSAAAVGFLVPVVGAQPPDVKGLNDATKKQVDEAKKKLEDAVKGAQPGGDMDEMTKKMMELASPGKEHEMLKMFVGTWKGVMTGMMESEGTMVNTLVMDGRFVKQEWSGKTPMGPFTGLGYWGYDRAEKKWVGTWMDTMGTGIMLMKGDYDAAKKTWTSTAEAFNPMTSKPEKITEIVTVVNNDTHTFEMFGPGPDGKDMSQFKITYTRVKDAMPAGKPVAPAAPAAPATKPTGK